MNKKILLSFIIIFLIISFQISPESGHFKETKESKILRVAGEIIRSAEFCVLISSGIDGFPNARIMEHFLPEKNWTVRMGTNSNSRKAREIREDNRITIFYESPGGDGYVNLKGRAFIIDDNEEKLKYFKKGWEKYYPGKRENFILIKIVPEKLEVVSYKDGLTGAKGSWEAPSVSFTDRLL